MEPKMEQPKQYTPEEMAQLEKSRTASDKALGDGGAEFVFNESGEKKNLLVTEEQANIEHGEFEKQESFGKERQKYNEEKAYFYSNVSEYVGRDITELLLKSEHLLKMPEKTPYFGKKSPFNEVTNFVDKFAPEIQEVLETLRSEYIRKVENDKNLPRETKLSLVEKVAEFRENLFHCSGCMWGFLNSIQRDDLTKKLSEEVALQRKIRDSFEK